MMYYELTSGDYFSCPNDKEPSTIYLFFLEKNKNWLTDADDWESEYNEKSIIVSSLYSSKIGNIVNFMPSTEIIPLNVTLKFEPKEI